MIRVTVEIDVSEEEARLVELALGATGWRPGRAARFVAEKGARAAIADYADRARLTQKVARLAAAGEIEIGRAGD